MSNRIFLIHLVTGSLLPRCISQTIALCLAVLSCLVITVKPAQQKLLVEALNEGYKRGFFRKKTKLFNSDFKIRKKGKCLIYVVIRIIIVRVEYCNHEALRKHTFEGILKRIA